MTKKLLTAVLLMTITTAVAQTIYPLTATKIPEGTYKMDTKNELPPFEGTWKGEWKGKTVILKFKKLTKSYNEMFKYYRDYLVGKYQVKDSNGKIIADNLNISDEKAKIRGSRIYPNGKYALILNDYDLCGMGGFVDISFANSSKTKLKLYYMPQYMILDTDCVLYGKGEIPHPFPDREEFILTKQ